MLISNSKIADTLREIANTLEEQEENPYKIRAYRRAANVIQRYMRRRCTKMK